MQLIFTLMPFLGDWLLFIFSMYQAGLELQSYEQFLNKYRNYSIKLNKVSPLYWILPPYKIYLEKKRATKILESIVKSQSQFNDIFNFLNKATAWWYVSIAGLLNAIYSTNELLDKLKIGTNPIIFLIIIIILFLFGLGQVKYRLSNQRKNKMYNQIKK